MAKYKICGVKNTAVNVPILGQSAPERVQFDETGIHFTDNEQIARFFLHRNKIGYRVFKENGKT